ncbi:hypothetical protein LTR53_011223 [Teratosphaeriaceae sp. CCFEE 6253]|nr:hypothetical protein LTR53_011223 [Teratosphaeriaceae sp. CCFEE 6253]
MPTTQSPLMTNAALKTQQSLTTALSLARRDIANLRADYTALARRYARIPPSAFDAPTWLGHSVLAAADLILDVVAAELAAGDLAAAGVGIELWAFEGRVMTVEQVREWVGTLGGSLGALERVAGLMVAGRRRGT